jgi:hypothetical protein
MNTRDNTPVNFYWYLTISQKAVFDIAPDDFAKSDSTSLCILLFDEQRHSRLRHSLDRTFDNISDSYKLVKSEFSTVSIYGDKDHPHSYRFYVLARNSHYP